MKRDTDADDNRRGRGTVRPSVGEDLRIAVSCAVSQRTHPEPRAGNRWVVYGLLDAFAVLMIQLSLVAGRIFVRGTNSVSALSY
jgi:hypothetical protein